MTERIRNTLGYLRWVLLTATVILVGVATVDTAPTFREVAATATATTPGNWSTYRVEPYTCARVATGDPADDPCVFDPDPAGSPVAVEPDNDPTPRRYLPDGTDVRVALVPVASWTTTPPPVDTPPVADTPPAGDPQEDDAGWDCRRHGNGVCGPGNPQGVQAGCYVRSGKRAGVLLRPWDDATMNGAHPWVHYRPDGCGKRTARDRAMDDRLSGKVGQLCADNATGGVTCWYADQPRPAGANGPARTP